MLIAKLQARTARVGVAMGDLYPKLTLSGQAGYQSQTLPMLTNWASRFFTAGPTVQLPIFEGGRLRAAVRLQDAEAQAATLNYRGAVQRLLAGLILAPRCQSLARSARHNVRHATPRAL